MQYSPEDLAKLMDISSAEIQDYIANDPDFPKPVSGFYSQKVVDELVGPVAGVAVAAEVANRPAVALNLFSLSIQLPLVDRVTATATYVSPVNRRELVHSQRKILARVLAGCVAAGVKTNSGTLVTNQADLMDWLIEQVDQVA